MKNITKLQLIGCSITGSIPSSIWNLLQIQVLELADNALTGSFKFPGAVGISCLSIITSSVDLLVRNFCRFVGWGRFRRFDFLQIFSGKSDALEPLSPLDFGVINIDQASFAQYF